MLVVLYCIAVLLISCDALVDTKMNRFVIKNLCENCQQQHAAFSISADNILSKTWKPLVGTFLCSLYLNQPLPVHAQSFSSSISTATSVSKVTKDIDRGSNWERSRQKRTVAIKEMQSKGIIKVETDDAGSQILRFPWIPDMKVPYKSLSLQQRLLNEVCAGAFGEFCKDFLLHPVDTLKTRRQAKKKNSGGNLPVENNMQPTMVQLEPSTESSSPADPPLNPIEAIKQLKTLYSGFPIVLSASIPQGGTFFLIKKGLLEFFSVALPATPDVVKSMVSIAVGVMGYWTFRTPAEIIKTQVQTGQAPSVKDSIETIRIENDGNFKVLWKYFPVMMWLDIPFQVMNFILYGIISEAITQAGIEPSTLTRLVCGVASGMFCAGVTCPVDVCKTRIISRDKENSRRLKQMREAERVAQSDVKSSTTGAIPLDLSDGSVSMIAASTSVVSNISNSSTIDSSELNTNMNVPVEMLRIFKEEGGATLFLGLQPRLLYTGLANGIRLAAYGTSRMDLMMRSLDDI